MSPTAQPLDPAYTFVRLRLPQGWVQHKKHDLPQLIRKMGLTLLNFYYLIKFFLKKNQM